MLEINPARVLGDLTTLRGIGTYKTGVHRPTFSPEDVQARNWIANRMAEAGLEARIDGIGNIFGSSSDAGLKVLAGSHIETQNYAGWLDGALGVVYALEVARALREYASASPVGIDVVVLCDEEGHFGSFLGSRSFIGILEESDIDNAANIYTGISLREALAKVGYAGRPRMVIAPDRYAGFFEAHIEQGDTLISSGKKIGIVTGVVGIWQYEITVEGEQNHAGTTSMARRRDAGLALIRLLSEIDLRFPEICGPRTVWTTGRIQLEPGAKSIIPGRATALFQFRDTDIAVLQRLESGLEELVADKNRTGSCAFTLTRLSASLPTAMDERLMEAIECAAEHCSRESHVRMPSGAGHDAQFLARKLPAAMMFVPSIGGISHHWTENTADEDIILGAQVFAGAIANVLGV